MKKLFLLISLLILILGLVGCTEDGSVNINSNSAQEIQQKVIEANSNLKSYSTDVVMDVSMQMDMMGETLNVSYVMNVKGDVDQENKAMYFTTDIDSDMPGVSMTTDSYLVGDYLYYKVMGMWFKTAFEQQLWDSQAQADQLLSLMESGNIELLPDDKIDGVSYYVVKLNPDIEEIVRNSLMQQSSELTAEVGDLGSMIDQFEYTVWINKETYLMEYSDSSIVMNLDVSEDGTQGTSTMEMNSKIKIYNFGEDFDITLPSEALEAQDLTEFIAEN